MDAFIVIVAESGRKERGPCITTIFTLGVENEQVDAGRDVRTWLVKPNYQAPTRTGQMNFPCSGDHKEDLRPCKVDAPIC